MMSRWLTDPVECGPRAGFGIYLHIPFCAHRCGYCDFATYDDRGHLVSRYIAALRRDVVRWAEAGPWPWGGRPEAGGRGRGPDQGGRPEVGGRGRGPDQGGRPEVGGRGRGPDQGGRPEVGGRGRGPDQGSLPEAGGWTGWPPVTSIFVGGGTPTLLPAEDLAGLLAVVGEHFVVTPDAEITIEANPESVEEEALASLVEAGVNRVSIGAQSFTPSVLDTLERRHDPGRPLVAVDAAQEAGIANVNIDLIYGTPGETDDDWERTVETVLDAGIDHVSAYALTVAANTPLARRVATGGLPSPDGDVQRRRFDLIRDALAAESFDHYEVSNWARSPAGRCRHNLLYWRHGDYLGIGVGAHGHYRGRRWWSHRSIERYCAEVEANANVVSGAESLSIAERAEERLLLGLRLADGLHPLDLPPLREQGLEDVARVGLARLSCGRLQATEGGWFLLDETLARLLA